MEGKSLSQVGDIVKKQLSELKAIADDLKEQENINKDNVNTLGTWSCLKLVALSGIIRMYTKVISSNVHNFYYFDACAGSGLNRPKSQQDFLIAGSPIIAAISNQGNFFDRMYFIENDQKKADALKKRLEYLYKSYPDKTPDKKNYKVIRGDANEEIPYLVPKISKHIENSRGWKYNYLGFIDNEGLTVNWKSLRTLNSRLNMGDLVINLQTNDNGRTFGKAFSNNLNSQEKSLYEFLGVKNVQKIHKLLKKHEITNFKNNKREAYKNLYMERLKDLGLTKQVPMKIKKDKSYGYDLLYSTRKTEKDSGYIKQVEWVKELVESLNGKNVEYLLKTLKGKCNPLGCE